MSGGGSNPPEPPPKTNCRDLSGRVILSSVNAQALDQLSTGDLLYVELRSENGPIVALTESGSVVGSIATSLVEELLKCLRQGFSYHAEVLDIDEGRCEVSVSLA